MPRVSWLIPVYNAGAFLDAALRSVRDQTFDDFEAVIVDDGSTDGSADIIRRHCEDDGRLTALRKSNSGIIDTLNLGLEHCRGVYVARMDADDICEPQRLEVQVGFMDAHPQCAAAGSRIIVIDEAGRTVRNAAATGWRPAGPTGFPPRSITLTHPTILARTAALRRAGGYRHAFPAAEDYDLLFRLAREGELVELPERLLRYRVHARSESAIKIGQQRLSCIKAEVAAFALERGLDPAATDPVLRATTIDDLCRAATAGSQGLPDAAILRTHYLAEYLKRATYRLSGAESLAAAGALLGQLARMAPRSASASARPFVGKGLRELARWALVTAASRRTGAWRRRIGVARTGLPRASRPR